MGHLVNFIVGWITLFLILVIITMKNIILWDWDNKSSDAINDIYSQKILNDMLFKWNK